jgi:hypothetical protein
MLMSQVPKEERKEKLTFLAGCAYKAMSHRGRRDTARREPSSQRSRSRNPRKSHYGREQITKDADPYKEVFALNELTGDIKWCTLD